VNAISQHSVQVSGPRLDNRRVAAGIVDLAVVGLVGAVLRAAAGGEFTAALAAVTIAWGLFYYFVTESTSGQTLGKRLLGLRVERTEGGPADERAIAQRTVLRLVDGIGFYVVGLVVMLRTGERRQRLGDIVAATRIVDAREPAKPTLKSTLNAKETPVAAAEPVEAPEAPEAPHRAEVPSQLFDLDRERESEPVEEDEGPRVEIVSSAAEEPPAEEQPVAEEPVAEEPAAEEPEPEDRPEEDASDDGGVLPRVSSPALEELADDVASSAATPRRRPRVRTPEESEGAAPEPEKAPADEPLTVKPVETVSPMDMVMAETDDESEPEQAEEGPRPPARTRGGAA
jgi:uncharacterized RDD family membrane protein YckC